MIEKEPLFDRKLYVGQPNEIDRGKLIERLNDILDRNWLTNNGPYVQAFEQMLADFLGARHCIAMCNGTVALEIAIRALNLSGEVIIPSMTFIATAHALQWQEITPVFCDIDAASFCIDPEEIEALITPRTSGIIGVPLYGRPCENDAIEELAARKGLAVLYDSAHGLGCSYKGRMLGTFGRAEVFSFHATKFVHTFEGGAVATNDDVLARKMRLMRNFGFSGFDNVIYVGTNGKMSEISGAMGITALESMEAVIARNRTNYHCYRKELAGIQGVTLMEYDEREKCNCQYIVVTVNEAAAGISRDQLMRVLHAENVIARRYFYPGCHRMEPYRSYFPNAGLMLPVTEQVCAEVLVLPTGTAVGDAEIQAICRLIKDSVQAVQKIQGKLVAQQ